MIAMTQNGAGVIQNAETIARIAISALLDGQAPNGAVPGEMGQFGECYSEMVRAYSDGGNEAARRVYATYAERDAPIAALRAADPKPTRRKWSVADLYNTKFPEPKFIVPGLLTCGLNNLAARPKMGKSWFALQVSAAVGCGGMVFGKQVEQGQVLYLALEDSPRRIEARLRLQRAPSNAMIDFVYDWRPLGDGGLSDLASEIDKYSYDFIVIDTIARALGFIDPNKQAENTVLLGAIQRLAVDRDLTILLIDHHRKSAGREMGGDAIDDVLGATGKTGVLDVSIGLYRKRGERTATFKVTGRDIDEQEIAVKFDTLTCSWQLAEDGSGVRVDSLQSKILDSVREIGDTATVAKVAERLGRERSNIHVEMTELVNKGRLLRHDKVGKEVCYTVIE